jgi:5-methylcytosine-specific restriction endonuclease McrA
MSAQHAVRRNTTRRDRHRRQLARGKPPCGICTEPINYDTHHLDPKSFTIDHIVPLAKGGSDTLDNLQPCCRACNRAKSDTHDVNPTWETWRTW